MTRTRHGTPLLVVLLALPSLLALGGCGGSANSAAPSTTVGTERSTSRAGEGGDLEDTEDLSTLVARMERADQELASWGGAVEVQGGMDPPTSTVDPATPEGAAPDRAERPVAAETPSSQSVDSVDIAAAPAASSAAQDRCITGRQLADTICTLSERVCEMAADDPRCDDGQQRCSRAQARVGRVCGQQK